MSKTTMSPLMLAGLAAGAYLLLFQRNAVSSALAPLKTIGNPAYGTQGAISSPAVSRYYVPPSGVVPKAQPQSTLQTLLSFGTSLFKGAAPAASKVTPLGSVVPTTDAMVRAYSQGGPSTGVYGLSEIDKMDNAYSQGGPSTGVYGIVGGNPTAYGYADGVGAVDTSPDVILAGVDTSELWQWQRDDYDQ